MEFFQTEFYRIFYRFYGICRIWRKRILVVLKKEITKNNLLQILQILWNTIFSNFENENY